ncbi:AAA family ATPase [Parerythrobacter aurantius]|uniref:AAA family ATPase n=1 Tax=Parerythrobacter aurantius TaxID=3127706 RepID=UPI0032517949
MKSMGGELNLQTVGFDRMALGSARIAIVASPAHIDSLRSQPASEWLGNAHYAPLEAGQPVDVNALSACDVAIVEVDPAEPDSLSRIKQVKLYDRQLPLIVAMPSGDLATVRALIKSGVDDVVSLPLNAEEILQTVLAIIEVRAEHVTGPVTLAPVTVVCRAMGGCGATTVATHLAAALADPDAASPNVCLIDLDLQYGRIAESLGITPKRTFEDLASAGNRLDSAFLRSVAVPHAAGFAVVAAPAEIGPIEALDVEVLSAILRTARREFDHVIIDMPSDLTNWGLSVVSSADRVLMVLEPKVAAIRQAKRRLDLFRNLGFDLRLVTLVLNRAEKSIFGSISVNDVEDALHRSVDIAIRDEAKTVPVAQEQGLLAHEWRAKSTFWLDIRKLAETVRTATSQEQAA